MENETNHDLIISKIIAGSGLFVVSVICGVIPFKLAKIFKWDEPISDGTNTNSKRAVNMLLCFGGGVLLATTFLHLLPGKIPRKLRNIFVTLTFKAISSSLPGSL